MKDYFNLSTEEKIELQNKRDFRPERFVKPIEETTTTTTTLNITEDDTQ
tara:strand:+ start:357 stop:503 length:147 start_codon:yes stop_codon:yes gene_type:complete